VFGPLEGYPRSQELCHNCDTKPVFTVKTDFIDRTTLLILRNLLKTKVSPKIPAYKLIRQSICHSSTYNRPSYDVTPVYRGIASAAVAQGLNTSPLSVILGKS
jgi:hypothetical protein